MSLIDDINNPLELIKVDAALRSEHMKLEYRQKTRPDQVNILDYTVIAALEKQIPKKPIKDSVMDEKFWSQEPFERKIDVCPTCHNIYLTECQKYCNKCGQAIDWSAEE